MKKAILKISVLLGVFLAGGGSGAGAFYALSPKSQENKSEDKPSGEAAKKAKNHEEDPADKTKNIQMVQFQKDFTSNLLENGKFLQIGISVGLKTVDEKEIDIKEHEPQLRSAILAVLAEQSAVYLATASGKRYLQTEIKTALNTAFDTISGETPVDNVYFTSFIIQ
jgi:flagellar protein FliL